MRSVERLLGSAKHFPVEIARSSGDRHVIDHPDHATVRPKTKDLIIFPDEGDEFWLAINPVHIVQIRPLRKKGEAA
jgi:beta-glucosidase-like glycosyl hydrolase